jgi:succinoglycan biosynthesis protein ExoO
MASPLISVIVPAYNAHEYVAQAVESCQRQTITDLEIIVVDDASTDSTTAIVQAIEDPRVTLVRNVTNSGPGACRNLGMSVASGDWISFLDADDCYGHARLETLLNMAQRIGSNHVYSDDWIGWTGTEPPPRAMLECRPLSIEISRWSLEDWLEENREARILFHRSALHLVDSWFPDTRAGEDLVFTARLLKALQTPLVKLNSPTYIYRNTPGSITKSTSQLSGALEIEKSYRIICDEVLEGRHPAGVLIETVLDDVALKRFKGAFRRGNLLAAALLVIQTPRLVRTIPYRVLALVLTAVRKIKQALHQ